MKYPIIRNEKFDFSGESYSSSYPNLHKYPATMIPQIGIEILKKLEIKKGRLLDPYCGSGSSFIAGLDRGIKEMEGFDINPLAILISKAKFTNINVNDLKNIVNEIKNKIFELNFINEEIEVKTIPQVYNIDFWFPKSSIKILAYIRDLIYNIDSKFDKIKNFLLVPFSETVRECSYTRNSEFKLFRIRPEDMKKFKPDVFYIFTSKVDKAISIYEKYYYPLLDGAKIHLDYSKFPEKEKYYDIVLTSPPYGDSRTTVAYGQFSVLANEWLGISNARQIDNMLMGGKPALQLYHRGLLAKYLKDIAKVSEKRALEVSSFYEDLESSIQTVARSIRNGGKIIYVVGNRMVKDVILPTDQFIAEKFEENGFRHLVTYERLLSNKVMPASNSPSNITGVKRSTMTKEFIIVCEKSIGPENWVVCDKVIEKAKPKYKIKKKIIGKRKRGKVEESAQMILDVRKEFPDSSLADLYDPIAMPKKLVDAHKHLDKAVDLCYRPQPFPTELSRLEFLFDLYKKYTTPMFAEEKKIRR